MRTVILKIMAILRKPISHILWWALKLFLKKPAFKQWESLKQLNVSNFNNIMKTYKYKWDPAMGIVDYTLYDPDYFFDHENDNNWALGRDCDDFAHTWYWFLGQNDEIDDVRMIQSIQGWNVKTLHLFTVAKYRIDGKWRLFNFQMVPAKSWDNMDGAIEFLNDGNMAWCVYK